LRSAFSVCGDEPDHLICVTLPGARQETPDRRVKPAICAVRGMPGVIVAGILVYQTSSGDLVGSVSFLTADVNSGNEDAAIAVSKRDQSSPLDISFF
jgi:hypothetical protein